MAAIKENFTVGLVMAGFAGGTFCTGLGLSALHANPLKIEVSSYSELIASLLGAIVGGGVSITGTFLFNRADRKRTERAKAFTILHTASMMYSDMANIIGDLERQLSIRSAHVAAGAKKWTVVMPNSSMHLDRQFATEDLSLVFAMGEYDLHADLVLLETYRNSVSEAWSTFCTSRRELRSVMKVETITDGLVSSPVDFEQNGEAALRILELESLLESMLTTGPKFLEVGRRALGAVGPAFSRHFNDPKFPTVEITKVNPEAAVSSAG